MRSPRTTSFAYSSRGKLGRFPHVSRWIHLRVVIPILFVVGFVGTDVLADALRPHSAMLTVEGFDNLRQQPVSHSVPTGTSARETIQPINVRGRVYGLGRVSARLELKRNLLSATQERVSQATEATARDVGQSASGVSEGLLAGGVFQGSIAIGGGLRWRNNSRVKPLAGALIGDRLVLDFIGPSRGSRGRRRAYTIVLSRNASQKTSARIKSVPVSAKATHNCDTIHESVEGETERVRAEQEPFGTVKEGDQLEVSATYRTISLSTDADPEWYARYGEHSLSEITRIINAAEVLFLRDIGITLSLHKQHLYTENSPYTSTDAGALLGQFVTNPDNSTNLASSREEYQRAVDAKHLFTGKELDGSTVGIAYIASMCRYPSLAFGVSQASSDSSAVATFAHELAHNLGAYHDPASPGTLMYPSLSHSTITGFSEKSRGEIGDYLSLNAWCLDLSELPEPPQPGELPPPTPALTPDEDEESPIVGDDLPRLKLQVRRRTSKPVEALIRVLMTSAQGFAVPDQEVVLFRNGREVGRATTTDEGEVEFRVSLRSKLRRTIRFFAQSSDGALSSKTARIPSVTRP